MVDGTRRAKKSKVLKFTQQKFCGLGLTNGKERGYILGCPHGDHYTVLLDKGVS